jgi:hypothetical protein
MLDMFKRYGFTDVGYMKGDPVPAFGDPETNVVHHPVPTIAFWGRRAE